MINLLEYSCSVTALAHNLIILETKHLTEQNSICFVENQTIRLPVVCSKAWLYQTAHTLVMLSTNWGRSLNEGITLDHFDQFCMGSRAGSHFRTPLALSIIYCHLFLCEWISSLTSIIQYMSVMLYKRALSRVWLLPLWWSHSIYIPDEV